MYKDRIKKWNLDKKTKEEEAWALLRKKTQREAAGKESTFRVRGKMVTIDDVLRYFKRKGILNPEAQSQPPGPPTPPAIECWTPVTSPNQGFASVLEIEERGANWLEFRGAEPSDVPSFALGSTQGSGIPGYLNVNQTRRIMFTSPEIQSFDIASSPLPPQSLLMPEKLFASITAYLGGAFDGGLFKPNNKGYLVSSINKTIEGSHPGNFHDLCSSGVELMNSNSFVEGRRFFSKASSIISNLLRSQHPRTLEYVFYSLFRMGSHGYNQMSTLLRTHMRDIATLLFAEGHPWRQLFSQIADIEESHLQFALIEACRCICDTFANSLGQFHPTVLLSYTEFLSRLNDAQLLHDLLIRGEQELGKFDKRIVDIKYSYGLALYSHGQYAEAIEVLEEVLVRCKELGGQEYMVANSLDVIAQGGYFLGRHEENDVFRLQEAIRIIEAIASKFDSNVLLMKIYLEKRLRKLGRDAEAAEVQAEMNEALGPDDIELESN
jgi:tetratricopeptide (TPR) repeat protein